MRKKSLFRAFICILFLLFSFGNLIAAELPDWVERTSLTGEVTIMYQLQERELTNSSDQGIIKAKIGVESKIADKWDVGIGFATGDNLNLNDPRYSYQVLGGAFDTDAVNLDYAYAKYTHNENLSIIAGKFKNPIWQSKDLLWDTDINPEGLAGLINLKPSNKIDLEIFITPAYFMLEEFANSNDPAMYILQAGMIWKIDKSATMKLGATYYENNNVAGNWFWYSNGTNSLDPGWNLVDDYDTFVADMEVAYYLDEIANNKFTEMIPYVAIFTQYVNSDANDDDMAAMFGFKLGNEMVSDRGDWQFTYNYRKLERDAWLDFLPDSEFYRGDTAVKGSELELRIGVNKNITFGLDYYRTKPINRNMGDNEYLFQADLAFKF